MRVARAATLGLRNLVPTETELAPGINLLWGPNGAGKTTFLEGICLALAGRSPRTRRERETIAFDQALARVEAELVAEAETRTFLWSAARSGDRRHTVDGSPVSPGSPPSPSLSVFMPDRLAMVKGPPGARRDHLDRVVAAIWPSRQAARVRYARALAQRNALLGRVRAGLSRADSLDAWDAELAATGAELIAARAEAAQTLAPEFAAAAAELGAAAEAALAYRPRCRGSTADEIASELGERRDSDLARGFTGHGPHLDELSLSVGGRDLRRYGSQGEQRAGLLALLFAEREALAKTGRPLPLMLLDDVMSELDPERRSRLAARLEAGGGQVVITATEPGHLPPECERSELGLRAGAVLRAMPPAQRRAAA